jgi:hypothetical protein
MPSELCGDRLCVFDCASETWKPAVSRQMESMRVSVAKLGYCNEYSRSLCVSETMRAQRADIMLGWWSILVWQRVKRVDHLSLLNTYIRSDPNLAAYSATLPVPHALYHYVLMQPCQQRMQQQSEHPSHSSCAQR